MVVQRTLHVSRLTMAHLDNEDWCGYVRLIYWLRELVVKKCEIARNTSDLIRVMVQKVGRGYLNRRESFIDACIQGCKGRYHPVLESLAIL